MAEQTAVAEQASNLTGKKILIVEDDPLLHNLLADKMVQLRQKGLDVFPTVNAEEGLVKAREVKPDLIMLDIVLPGMTGFEFLEQLRKEPGLENTPVVVLSNLSDESDKDRARKLGVIAYLVKADFSLGDQRFLVAMDEFNRIFDGDDVTLVNGVPMVDHGRERG